MRIRKSERIAMNSVSSKIDKMYYEDRLTISEITRILVGVTREYVVSVIGTDREQARNLDEIYS